MFAMKKSLQMAFASSLAMFVLFSAQVSMGEVISLPKPSYKGTVSVEEALKARRTHRSFSDRAVTLEQFSQMLWAAYGVTAKNFGLHLKTAPSAGALYPLDIYGVVGEKTVETLASGVYHYRPDDHSINLIKEGDLRVGLAKRSLQQMWIAEAPFILVLTGEYQRSTIKYGRRGVTYTYIETGHVGQNIFLQAEALGLKAGIVGAFNNKQVIKALGLPASHDPLVLMPVGYSE